MKELVRHIESLLLEHDCVVVPQIGGFVTCNVAARYVEEEKLFLPPYRTVGFNEQLRSDDGLLLRSYADTYGIPEAEAKKILGAQLREMQQELWENGTYDLGSIGVLSMDSQDDIHFSPCLAGTVCPDFYGLDSLLFPKREEPETLVVAENRLTRAKQKKTEKEQEITIRLKKSWLHNVAAVAAAVVMFFLFSPKAGNTGVSQGGQAEFARLMVLPSVTTETTTEVALSNVPETVSTDVVPLSVEMEEKVQPSVQSVENKDVVQKQELSGYCVVVASAITEKNAESYVERLHKRGYKEAQVYKKGKMVRVVFSGYASEAEAHAGLRKLCEQAEEFSGAWVYQIK